MTTRPIPGLRSRSNTPFETDAARVISGLLRGKMNATLDVVLTASASTTIITDERLSEQSAVRFDPLTSNAALEKAAGTLWVSARTAGQITVTHANNAQTDRAFRLVILG